MPADWDPFKEFKGMDMQALQDGDPREDGDLLWPAHRDEQASSEYAKRLTSFRAAGQLQQRRDGQPRESRVERPEQRVAACTQRGPAHGAGERQEHERGVAEAKARAEARVAASVAQAQVNRQQRWERRRALAAEDFVVTGYVPDVTPYFTGCRVSIAPLRYGANFRNKP